LLAIVIVVDKMSIVSKTVTSATKLYVAALLHRFVFAEWGAPLWVTVVVCVLMIWIYTYFWLYRKAKYYRFVVYDCGICLRPVTRAFRFRTADPTAGKRPHHPYIALASPNAVRSYINT